MIDWKSKYEELLQRHHEAQAVCEIWVAANDAKDVHLSELESQVIQLQKRVARLSRLAGRRAAEQAPGQLLKIS